MKGQSPYCKDSDNLPIKLARLNSSISITLIIWPGTSARHDAGLPVRARGIGTLTIDGDYTSNGRRSQSRQSSATIPRRPTFWSLPSIRCLVLPRRAFATNLGGLSAETISDGIRMVQLNGTSAAGIFDLGGPAFGGACSYNLFQNGITDLTDGD